MTTERAKRRYDELVRRAGYLIRHATDPSLDPDVRYKAITAADDLLGEAARIEPFCIPSGVLRRTGS